MPLCGKLKSVGHELFEIEPVLIDIDCKFPLSVIVFYYSFILSAKIADYYSGNLAGTDPLLGPYYCIVYIFAILPPLALFQEKLSLQLLLHCLCKNLILTDLLLNCKKSYCLFSEWHIR